MRSAPRIAAIFFVTMIESVAFAQTPPPPAIIESEGVASVDVVPDEVRFELAKSFTGPTLIDATAQAMAFEKSVTQALRDLELQPTRQDGVRMTIGGLQSPALAARIGIVFAMPAEPRGAAPTAGPPPLAALADKLRKAGVSLAADATFIGFGVKDRSVEEQDAIARASENALIHADAVGALLNGRVLGVERVVIVETGWDGLDAREGALPIPPALKCHARVKISYQYSSSAK